MVESQLPSAQESPSSANPFDARDVAGRYEGWYSGPGRRADLLEKKLFDRLLGGFPEARTALEIGCGTGHFTRWLANRSLEMTGLDRSDAMLAEARTFNGQRYVQGDALNLPFDDRAFDLTFLITTLEFLDDPLGGLREAIRVARRGLILGVLNRWSILALKYRRSGSPLWKSARFFGPRELEQLVQTAAGQRLSGVHWRTTLLPVPWVADLPVPWGGFIGLAAMLADVK